MFQREKFKTNKKYTETEKKLRVAWQIKNKTKQTTKNTQIFKEGNIKSMLNRMFSYENKEAAKVFHGASSLM